MPRILGELDSRFMIIQKFLFGENGFFGANDALKDFIIYRQHEIIEEHLLAYKRGEDASKIRRRMEWRGQKPAPSAILASKNIPWVARLRSDYTINRLRRFSPSSVRQTILVETAFEKRIQNRYAATAAAGPDRSEDVSAPDDEPTTKPCREISTTKSRRFTPAAVKLMRLGEHGSTPARLIILASHRLLTKCS